MSCVSGKEKTNFERLKQIESEYEMADIIMNFLSSNYGKVIKGDGTLEGLPLLKWLQEESNKE